MGSLERRTAIGGDFGPDKERRGGQGRKKDPTLDSEGDFPRASSGNSGREGRADGSRLGVERRVANSTSCHAPGRSTVSRPGSPKADRWQSNAALPGYSTAKHAQASASFPPTHCVMVGQSWARRHYGTTLPSSQAVTTRRISNRQFDDDPCRASMCQCVRQRPFATHTATN